MTKASDYKPNLVDPEDSEADNPRLDEWLRRTTTPLDILALFTIWLTVVPLGAIHNLAGRPIIWYIARLALSLVYAADMTVRTHLSKRGWRYVIRHPVGVLSVVVPAVRVFFSIRLLRSMFRKGNLGHFLLIALALSANITLIVYSFERRAAGATITTIGDAMWWACVTVSTVGYGDVYPITVGGRIFAVVLMSIGLVMLAVITATIASAFMDQAAQRRQQTLDDSDQKVTIELAANDSTIDGNELYATIDSRLERIESLLRDSK